MESVPTSPQRGPAGGATEEEVAMADEMVLETPGILLRIEDVIKDASDETELGSWDTALLEEILSAAEDVTATEKTARDVLLWDILLACDEVEL
jgi:hypothetical protein